MGNSCFSYFGLNFSNYKIKPLIEKKELFRFTYFYHTLAFYWALVFVYFPAKRVNIAKKYVR